MPISFSPWDLALVIVVTTQATLLAYLRQPRWKMLLFTLPFPFTLATLAVGRQIPIIMLTVLPLQLVTRLLQPTLGLMGALGVGWVVFLCVLFPLTRRQWQTASDGTGTS